MLTATSWIGHRIATATRCLHGPSYFSSAGQVQSTGTCSLMVLDTRGSLDRRSSRCEPARRRQIARIRTPHTWRVRVRDSSARVRRVDAWNRTYPVEGSLLRLRTSGREKPPCCGIQSPRLPIIVMFDRRQSNLSYSALFSRYLSVTCAGARHVSTAFCILESASLGRERRSIPRLL